MEISNFDCIGRMVGGKICKDFDFTFSNACHMGPEAVFFVTKKSKETAPGNLS